VEVLAVPDLATLADPTYRPPKGPNCTIGIILTALPESEAATLRAAMGNPHAPSTHIARALEAMGHPVKPFNIQRHRRGECRCGE
jgi:hypothetical protein